VRDYSVSQGWCGDAARRTPELRNGILLSPRLPEGRRGLFLRSGPGITPLEWGAPDSGFHLNSSHQLNSNRLKKHPFCMRTSRVVASAVVQIAMPQAVNRDPTLSAFLEPAGGSFIWIQALAVKPAPGLTRGAQPVREFLLEKHNRAICS